jgi:hypothetical protein
MLAGFRIRWDPEKMRIPDNSEEEKPHSRDMRSPWRLP